MARASFVKRFSEVGVPGGVLSALAAAFGLLGCGGEGTAESAGEALGTSRAALSETGEIRIAPAETVPISDGVVTASYGANQFVVLGSRELGRMTQTGANLDPEGIAHEPGPSVTFEPGLFRALAHDGTHSLALSTANGFFHPSIGGAPSVVSVQRFADNGTFVDGFEIGDGAKAGIDGGELACGTGHCLALFWSPTGGWLAFFRTSAAAPAQSPLIALPEQRFVSGSVRFDGTQYLVALASVQLDEYGQPTDSLTWSTLRVDAAGSLLDAAPRAIRTITSARDTGTGALATNGQGYLLVYPDGAASENRVMAQRLDRLGLADGAAFRLTSVGTRSTYVTAASDGDRYMALWRSCTDARLCKVQGRVFDAASGRAGALREYGDADSPNVSSAWAQTRTQLAPALVWGGESYLAAWAELPLRELYARRLSSDGAVLDRQVVLHENVVPHEVSAAVAWNGCSYFASYYQTYNSAESYVVGTFLDGNGNAQQPLPFIVKQEFGQSDQEREHQLVGSASGFLRLSPYPNTKLGAERLSPSGALLDKSIIYPVPVAEPTYPEQYLLKGAAAIGTGWMTVVTRGPYVGGSDIPEGNDVYVQAINASGNVGVMKPVTTADGFQHSPSIASNGAGLFAVWLDERAGYEVWGAFLSATGNRVGSEFRIGRASLDRIAPRLSSDGSGYLVAWQEGQTLWAQKFGGVGGSALRLGETGTLRRLTYDGRTFLVFSAHIQSDGTQTTSVQRVARDGSLLDIAAVPLSIPHLKDVASDGLGRTLLTYNRSDGRVAARFLMASDAGPFPSTCAPTGNPPPQCGFSPPRRSTGDVVAITGLLVALAIRRRRARLA